MSKFTCWICEECPDPPDLKASTLSVACPEKPPEKLTKETSLDAQSLKAPAKVEPEIRRQQENTPVHFRRESEPIQASWEERLGMSQSPRDNERTRLRELMKDFAERSMRGTSIQLMDEATGNLQPGTFRIDERLSTLSFIQDDGDERSSVPVTTHIEQVLEIGRAWDARRHLREDIWDQLSAIDRLTLLSLVYRSVGTDEIPEETRKVFFTCTYEEEAKVFVTCTRILKKYLEDIKMNGPRSI